MADDAFATACGFSLKFLSISFLCLIWRQNIGNNVSSLPDIYVKLQISSTTYLLLFIWLVLDNIRGWRQLPHNSSSTGVI
jgi:hypothetical protein